MKAIKHLLIISSFLSTAGTMAQERCFHMPMEAKYGQVTESVSGKKFGVNAANIVETIPGAKGNALRLDGYSNFITGEIAAGELSTFTFSLWSAMETWPIIEHDIQNEKDMTCIAGNYDAGKKQGCGFFVSRTGKLSFKFFSGGWPGEIIAPTPLPLYQWNNLVAVCDGKKATLYNNGTALGSTNCRKISMDGTFMVGKSAEERKMGPFNLYTVNGIIDEVEIFKEALSEETIKGWKAENEPLLSITADDRYADDLMRPRFHGMPTRNWTNETHGLVHHNGKYHLFFQKNANGPYMSRLQWGHIVSDNLYDWKEMPIAIGSDKWYDLKGCWSGCIAIDNEVTGGKPNIIYTGVDYARAMIAQAAPDDDNLLAWTKRNNPIIDGKPSGLSDDFRDPYFFRNGADAYIIVGTSKDGKGACTLHKFNPATQGWSNDGKIFFSAANTAAQGTFWEMPNVTPMGGKFLFTVTPQGIGTGVKAIYWTGTINSDGTFNPDGSPADIELPGFAKDGYGLLSPSIVQVNGKTIAIGIVPDKLPSEANYDLGWAHTYSLPREWTINANGMLEQKPYEGLTAMRLGSSIADINRTINGAVEIGQMTDRQMEIMGEFTVGNADFGFSLFKNANGEATLSYSPASGKLTLDMRRLNRMVNDNPTFNGLYETTLPESVAKGSVMKIHVFIDHSIMDIFINDKWAFSVRIFPKDSDATGTEVFANGDTQAKVYAWHLNTASSGIGDILQGNCPRHDKMNVYSLSGSLLRSNVSEDNAIAGLQPGAYIVGNRKVIVR